VQLHAPPRARGPPAAQAADRGGAAQEVARRGRPRRAQQLGQGHPARSPPRSRRAVHQRRRLPRVCGAQQAGCCRLCRAGRRLATRASRPAERCAGCRIFDAIAHVKQWLSSRGQAPPPCMKTPAGPLDAAAAHQANAVFSAPAMALDSAFCCAASMNMNSSMCGSSAMNMWYEPLRSACTTCSTCARARSWCAMRSADRRTPAAVTEQSPNRPSVSSANSLGRAERAPDAGPGCACSPERGAGAAAAAAPARVALHVRVYRLALPAKVAPERAQPCLASLGLGASLHAWLTALWDPRRADARLCGRRCLLSLSQGRLQASTTGWRARDRVVVHPSTNAPCKADL